MLTMRQRRFADIYLECGDPVTAFLRAGYRAKNVVAGYKRLLATPDVQAYIAGKKNQRCVADEDEVLEYLTQVLRGEHGTDRERMRAAEPLGMRHGLFREKDTTGTSAAVIISGDSCE